jgi:hypothetical protein
VWTAKAFRVNEEEYVMYNFRVSKVILNNSSGSSPELSKAGNIEFWFPIDFAAFAYFPSSNQGREILFDAIAEIDFMKFTVMVKS